MALQREQDLHQIGPHVTSAQAGIAANAEAIWEGGMMLSTADGYVAKVGDGTVTGLGKAVVGIARFNAIGGTTDGEKSLDMYHGVFARPNSTTTPVTWASFSKRVYAEDDEKLTSDPAYPVAGTMWGFTEKGEVIFAIGSDNAATDGLVAFIAAPLDAATEADGTPLAAWVDGVTPTPGYDSGGGEFKNIRWNPNAAPDPISLSFVLPPNLDADRDIYVYMLAAKAAAGGDLPTMTVGAYFQTIGSAYDADANAGGVTNAMTDAAKTVQILVRAIAAANVPASTATSPALLNLTLGPTAGTLPADDVLLGAVFIAYSTK